MTVDVCELVRLRSHRPEAIAEAAARRPRRPLLNGNGRLMIVAADHPARGALGVGGRALAMANRADLLERLCLALSRPGVDGVLATADILDDLLLLGALDGKVVLGSMNRGGLQGARFTATALSGVRRRGWAQSIGEREPGVASVSAPVRGPSNRVVAAVSVSGPIERLTRHPGRMHAQAVIDAASRLSEALRRTG